MIIDTYTHNEAPGLTTRLVKLGKGESYNGFTGESCVRLDMDPGMTVCDEYDVSEFDATSRKLIDKGWVKS